MPSIESSPPKYPFALPPLRFNYDALEPYLDAETLEIHHAQHHANDVKNLNAALVAYPELHDLTIEELLRAIETVPDAVRPTVRQYGGGHANHQFLWKVLSPAPNLPPQGGILAAINDGFGSFEKFKSEFTEAAIKLFGSGWVFLVVDPQANGRLKIVSASNHDSVLYYGTPGLLICDVWEHAYYLKHQNRRQDYLGDYWRLVDWKIVDQRLEGIRLGKKQL